jgi:predicted transport protein
LVWLKLKYARLENPPTFARDVSHIGHWGVGDVELAIRSVENLGSALPLIQQSYDENK